MTINKLAGLVSALAIIAGAVLWPINHFQSVSAAEADKKEVQQTVEQLRAEVLLQRVKALAEKEAKEGLTPAEKGERDLNLEQVKAIQAEAAKKSK